MYPHPPDMHVGDRVSGVRLVQPAEIDRWEVLALLLSLAKVGGGCNAMGIMQNRW